MNIPLAGPFGLALFSLFVFGSDGDSNAHVPVAGYVCSTPVALCGFTWSNRSASRDIQEGPRHV
mgnify:CR=1 FL=1